MRLQKRSSQSDRLLALLKGRVNLWVPLPHILALGIAQYNARIYELRALGHRIENKQEGDHSWFRLVTTAVPVVALESQVIPESPLGSDFPELGKLSPDRSYQE